MSEERQIFVSLLKVLCPPQLALLNQWCFFKSVARCISDTDLQQRKTKPTFFCHNLFSNGFLDFQRRIACCLVVNLVPRCTLQKSELFYNSSTIHVAYVHDIPDGYLFIFEAWHMQHIFMEKKKIHVADANIVGRRL